MAITSPPLRAEGGSCCLSRCFSQPSRGSAGASGRCQELSKLAPGPRARWHPRLPALALALGSQLTGKKTGEATGREGRTGRRAGGLPVARGPRTSDWKLEQAGATSSSHQSWRLRGATFPARARCAATPSPAGFGVRADPPPGLLLATGPWTASLQPGQPLPGHLEETSEHQTTRAGFPGTSAAGARASGSNSLAQVLDLPSEPPLALMGTLQPREARAAP